MVDLRFAYFAHRGPRCHSNLGRGFGTFRRIQNIHRHAKCPEHKDAEAAWKERVRAEGSHQGVQVFSAAATAAPLAPVVVQVNFGKEFPVRA